MTPAEDPASTSVGQKANPKGSGMVIRGRVSSPLKQNFTRFVNGLLSSPSAEKPTIGRLPLTVPEWTERVSFTREKPHPSMRPQA